MGAEALYAVLTSGTAVLFLALVVLSRRARRHGGALRSGLIGAMFEMHDRDKQRALEAIVEGRTAEGGSTHADDTVPGSDRGDPA